MKLKNKHAIITGANQGFGLAIAKKFVSEGAKVLLCARNSELLRNAADEIELEAGIKNQITTYQADISNIEQVDELIKKGIELFGSIDILVANAGVYGTKGPIDEVDWNEWSHAIDINLKGTVYLCKTILPYFKQKKAGKIVIIAGGGATKPMPNLSAYAASKAGVVRFGETLAEEVKTFGIDVNMVAPGAMNTRLLDEVLSAGPEKVGESFYQQSLKQKATGGMSSEPGANLCVFLSSEKSNGITGKLISAVWDPWEKLADYTSDLNNSDIYTLRRIIPQDRGKTWGDVL